LFVLDQPEGEEGIEDDNVNEGIEAGGDDTQMETAAWGASAAEEGEDNTEVEANASAEAPTTDVAAASEVWVLESGFVFECWFL
jgi:hypothetical protein